VALVLAAAGLDRTSSAQRGKRGVAVQAIEVATRGDEQLRGAVNSDSRASDQLRDGLPDQSPDLRVKVENFLVKQQPAPAEAAQGGVHPGTRSGLAAAGRQIQEALTFIWSRRCSGQPMSRALIWLLAWVVAFTALLRASVSARNASTSPSRSFGTALA
jgi:hypothetical protein